MTQSSAAASTDVYVGRQPIFDADFKTYAYELLFRSGENNQANIVDGSKATAELLLNTFAEIGIEQVVGKLPAFININTDFILQGHCYALPKERMVLEVLEDVAASPEIVAALTSLVDEGYTIALDDFVDSPDRMPLVDLADIVKIDLSLVPASELPELVKRLREQGVNRLLAEKVESFDEFNLCKELGFDLFQGYVFCQPSIIKERRIPANRISLMQLLAKLQNPNSTIAEVSDAIRTVPTFAVKLLQYVNSAFLGLSHKIESIEHAVAMVGVRQIRTICSLSALVSATNDKPEEFIKTLLVRAKMAEFLAQAFGEPNTDRFFMVGLFSGLDGLLNMPMEEALKRVPVSDEVHQAINELSGQLGMVLQYVLAYERGRFNHPTFDDLGGGAITDSYLEAVAWTDSVLSEQLFG